MLGAAGALLCMALGTALGAGLKERRCARLRLLENELELLARMRLLILEERLGLPALLRVCASDGDEGVFSHRLEKAAEILEKHPLLGLRDAYQQATSALPLSAEKSEEKAVLDGLFAQLGTGTASMREQAASSAIRRLRPLAEKAREQAEKGGKLLMQLGLLFGLMLGIALW